MLYDAHTHLNGELYPEREAHLTQFIQAGGKWLVNAWASDEYNTKWIEIAQKASACLVKATIGYHPDSCTNGEITEQNLQEKIQGLKKLYEENKEYIVAIGECGIDTYYPGTEDSLPLQKKLFALQCDLAKELNLPVMIHIRKDFVSALEIIKQYQNMTIYVHCRWFWPEEYQLLHSESKIQNSKLFIWFCGNITYKNAQNLRDTLLQVDSDQLVLETDAPRLSPQAVRGTTNTPANVKYLYDFVAELKGISVQELSLQLEKNIQALYTL